MNPQTITTVAAVDPVFYFIFGVSVLMLIGITIAMIWFVIRYNRKRCPVPESQKDNNIWLETIWTVIPTIIVLLMFWFGWEGYLSLRRIPDNAMPVQATARMWSWLFTYENGKTSDKLYVPVGQPIKVKLLSEDVLHSFYVPAFRVKRDCVPGMENYAWFVADKAGSFDLFCAEYCGVAHADMVTTVEAVPAAEFATWLEADDAAGAHPGQVALENFGCLGCHSLDGSKQVGPSFKDIAGRQTVVVVDGAEKTIIVDRDYLLRAINEPNAEVVKGFPPAMPPYEGSIDEETLNSIVDFLLQKEQLESAEEHKTEPAEHLESVESGHPDKSAAEHGGDDKAEKEKEKSVSEKAHLDGLQLMQDNGCLGCHSTDGKKRVGPTFKGIVGRPVTVKRDGAEQTLTSDREYLHRAIVNPEAEIVVGNPPAMPAYDWMADEEVEAIIDTMETMK